LQAATEELKTKLTIISKLNPELVSVVNARSALLVPGYPPCPSPVFSHGGGCGYASGCYLPEEYDMGEEGEKGKMDEPEAREAKEGNEMLQEEETGRQETTPCHYLPAKVAAYLKPPAAAAAAGAAYPLLLARMELPL
jgi:hypothetical protein